MLKKKELLAEVAKAAGKDITPKIVESVISGLNSVIITELSKEEKTKVVIPSLFTATASLKEGGKRTVRNPRTGEVSVKEVPDKMVVKNKPDKSIADAIPLPTKKAKTKK